MAGANRSWRKWAQYVSPCLATLQYGFEMALIIVVMVAGETSSSTFECFDLCTCSSYYSVYMRSTDIDCRGRGISTVSNLSSEVPAAVNVDFSENNIEFIVHNVFGDLPYLRKVLLNSNYLEYVGAGAFNGTDGKHSTVLYIDLSDNHLHIIPPCFQYQNIYTTKLHNLTHLLLAGNELGPIIEENILSATRYLEELDLSRNRISTLQERTLRYMPNLRYVDLRFNAIDYIAPSVFGRNTPLKSLRLTGNLLTAVPGGMPATLSLLELGENNILNITLTQLQSLRELRELEILNISHNGLRAIVGAAFLRMSKLRILDLSNNNLYRLHADTFVGADSLEYLFLNRNIYLANLPADVFTGLVSLRFLFLYGCSLKTLSIGPPTISPMDVAFTSAITSQTVEVDPSLAPKLEAMWLFGNPFNCDCQTLPLVWFVNVRNITVDAGYDDAGTGFGEDEVVRTYLRYDGGYGGVLPIPSTLCSTPFNRHKVVVGKRLLDVPESDLVCPDQPFFIIVSMMLGIALFAAAIPAVFIMVFIYLFFCKCLTKYLGISINGEDESN